MDQDNALRRFCYSRSPSPIPSCDSDPGQMDFSGGAQLPTSYEYPSFHFVNISGSARCADRRDSPARKAIHRHVMHDFVRKKQQESALRSNTSIPASPRRSLRTDVRPFNRVIRRPSQFSFGRSRSFPSGVFPDPAMGSNSMKIAKTNPPRSRQCPLIEFEPETGGADYSRTVQVAQSSSELPIVTSRRQSRANEHDQFPASFGPQSLLDTGNPDPFVTSNVMLTPNMQHHILRYLNLIVPNAIRPQHPTDVVSIGRFQIDNKAVLYSSIAVAAVYDRFIKGTLPVLVESLKDEQTKSSRLPEFFFFETKAIAAINDALDDLTQGTSDSTIGAILNICGLETMLNNRQQLLVHLQGLREIIKQRGGLHSLPQLLQNSVSLLDVLTCHLFDDALLFQAPALPHNRPSDLIAQMLTSDYPDLRRQGSTLLELSCFIAVHPALVDVWRDLRNLTNFSAWCKMYPQSVTADQVRYFRVKYHHVEHSLITLGNGEKIPILSKTAFEESCRLATRLFVNSVLYKGLPYYPRTRLLVTTLKSNLEASLLLPLTLAAHGKALFWMLSIGSLCSAGQVERPWFALHLVKIGKVLRVSSWESAKEVLLGCFYLEGPASVPLERSWEESQLLADLVDD